ncbi:MAG TPA: trypsin-like peptidase domain-containing protein [Vicinamibacteria bacterium]|nr:trypsin-like peptidase domain-containing protein [Vicinamibacteria bacterium]
MKRLVLLLAGLLGLGAGLAIGARLRWAVEPPTLAASPAEGRAPAALPGPDFASIARRATPAVVNISALQVYRSERSPFFSDPFFQDFFGPDDPFRIPREERKTSLGSGVIVSSDGVVVTNNHVIEHAREIAVTTSDRKRHRVTLVGADPVTDLAVLRIDGMSLPALPWGDSSAARVGEYVLAIGNPFQLNQTVTMGIISATGRSNVGIVDYEDFIQTDAAINPGNSGGALVDARSALIGINTAIYSRSGGYQGIGFAVPANLARKVVDQILAKGRVVRGYVGITRIADVGEREADALGLKAAQGAIIVEMRRRSPAAAAGLEPGDVVVAVDGAALQDAAQLRNALAAVEVGSRLRLTVVRDGRRRELEVAVEEAQPNG